jgi:hypothetical protein
MKAQMFFVLGLLFSGAVNSAPLDIGIEGGYREERGAVLHLRVSSDKSFVWLSECVSGSMQGHYNSCASSDDTRGFDFDMDGDCDTEFDGDSRRGGNGESLEFCADDDCLFIIGDSPAKLKLKVETKHRSGPKTLLFATRSDDGKSCALSPGLTGRRLP